MHLTQMDTFLIRVLYLLAAGIVCTTVLGFESVSSALFALTFVFVILLWMAGAIRNVTWTDIILILTAGLALANILINATIQGTTVTFAYFKKYIMFISTLLYFQAAHKLSVDEKTERFLLSLNSVLAVFFAVVFASDVPTLYTIRGRISDYLTFGFTNPNLTALFLLCIYTGELVQIPRSQSVLVKLCHLLLAGANWYFVRETGSRNCMLTMVMVTILCVLLYLTKRGFRLPKWFALLVSVWPILFVAAYIAFSESPWLQDMLSFIVDEGKELDSRVSIWLHALNYYGKAPVFGAYSQISRGTGISQLHNTHLDVLVSYGTLILVLMCYLLHNLIHSSGAENLKEETMMRICFSGTIIMGMGEAALFSGGLGIYLFAGMFLLLCNKKRQESAEYRVVNR